MIDFTLKKGDVIGIASPSHIATVEEYEPIFAAIRKMGYTVCHGKNFYSKSWGFAASAQERADDLHSLVASDKVRMIFFSGGEGADDVIPLLNYDLIASNPKIWLSFSDGTSILNAVHARTGLPVFYGQSPFDMVDPSEYNHGMFMDRFVCGTVAKHSKSGPWHILTKGKAWGTLCGGYLDNFTYLANGGWIDATPGKKYILFLEEHNTFFNVEHVSAELARLENSPIMGQIKGILFGQYSETVNEDLLLRLRLLGEKYNIPVAYCDDFGHGANHAIMPLGTSALLDTEGSGELFYL